MSSPIRKLALTGDTHADEPRRFEDYLRVMNWIVDDADDRGCDLMLHSGDAYERLSSPAERVALADWVRRVTARMELAIVAGNHDEPRDVELLGRLAPRDSAFEVHSFVVPGTWTGDGFVVHGLPWPRKAYLLAQLAAVEGGGDNLAHEALRQILTGFWIAPPEPGCEEDFIADKPRILLAHAMVRGSRLSNSQPARIGQDVELGLEDLALARADFVALGHVHLPQDWAIEGVPVVYPGSPRRCNFGEMEDKSYVVATFEGRRCVEWERIPTPCPPMLHLDANFEAGQIQWVDHEPLDGDMAGAEVRIRYEVAASERAGAAEAFRPIVEQLEREGARVKLEAQTRVETRARAPEVAAARSIRDKLIAHWEAKGAELLGRREQLLAKLDQLEEAAR